MPKRDRQLQKQIAELERRRGPTGPRPLDWFESLPLSAGYGYTWFVTDNDIHLYPLRLPARTAVRAISFYLYDGGAVDFKIAVALYRAELSAGYTPALSSTRNSVLAPANLRYTLHKRLGTLIPGSIASATNYDFFDILLPQEEVLDPGEGLHLAVQAPSTLYMPGDFPPRNADTAADFVNAHAHLGGGFLAIPTAGFGLFPDELVIDRSEPRPLVYFMMRSNNGLALSGHGRSI